MEVKDGSFILKKGSDVSPDVGAGLLPSIETLRNNSKVINGVLDEDISFTSPSACGEFILGASCNGWTNWKTADGEVIDIYRKS